MSLEFPAVIFSFGVLITVALVFYATAVPAESLVCVVADGYPHILNIALRQVKTTHTAIVVPLTFVASTMGAFLLAHASSD